MYVYQLTSLYSFLNSPDPFYVEALRSYISQFNFLGIPLDIALRKLLMEVGLPRETQQIDRVIEAFAFRYTQCNPNFFLLEGEIFSHPLSSSNSKFLQRSRICPSLQFDHVTYGCFQSVK
jgi:hypothetical protein